MENKGQIYELMGKVMGEIKAIGKTNTSGGLKYKFRGIDDIYLAVNPVLTKYGVFCMPERMENKRQVVTTKSGAKMTETLVTMKYTFYAPDGSSVYAIVDGEATDTSDKSCNQAMSAAHKYTILQAFFIPTDEPKDTENNHNELGEGSKPTPKVDNKKPKVDKTYEEDITELINSKQTGLISLVDRDTAGQEVLKIAKEFNVESLQDVTGLDQAKVILRLRDKLKQIKGDK